jgi:hypothetical protein
LIWDYTNRKPILSNDTANASLGGSVIIDVLSNDDVVDADVTVTINTPPLYGTAVVNLDKTITYTHDGTDNFDDSLIYEVSNGSCSSTATINIGIGVPCSGSISASGGTGIYEAIINVGTATGLTGIQYDSQGVPDRFEIYYDDVKVADSKYVGDSLSPGPPVSYSGLLGTKTGLSIYTYNGTSFVDSGTTEPDFDVIQADIADNITEAIDGNGTLLFNKTTPTPTVIKIRATGAVGGTAWTFNGICPIAAEDIIPGDDKFVYGHFTEANKALQTKSMKFYLGTSPVKFYTAANGATNFSSFTHSSDQRWINDGVTWWEIDDTGLILNTGTL